MWILVLYSNMLDENSSRTSFCSSTNFKVTLLSPALNSVSGTIIVKLGFGFSLYVPYPFTIEIKSYL